MPYFGKIDGLPYVEKLIHEIETEKEKEKKEMRERAEKEKEKNKGLDETQGSAAATVQVSLVEGGERDSTEMEA